VTQGQTVVINLNPNVPVTSVTWSPYIQGSTDNTEVGFVPQHTDTETVILTYGQSCKIYDTIVVEVAVDTGFFSKWSIPNTFTPNADGINDNFKVISSPDLSFFHIWIFDRWGNKVYESTDVGFLWDGLDQFAGNKPLNTGVFSYVIEYQEVNKDSKGNIGGNISLVK
jgi:gliding motility-associated-like protein